MNAPHRPASDNPFDDDRAPLRVVPMHRAGATRGPVLHDPDAERAVLAAVLLAPEHAGADRWNELAATVSAEHFAEPRHATIWEAMGRLAARRADIDLTTLPAELRAMEKLNAVGGAQYLGEITDVIPTVAHRTSHGRLVAERGAARAYLALAQRVVEEARRGVPAEILRETLTTGLAAVRLPGTVAPTLGDDLAGLFEELENPDTAPQGIGTGLPDLDRLLGGSLPKPGLTVLAARPRVGKTVLALQVSVLEASRGEPVLYLSFEMLTRALLRRAISAEANVLYDHVRNPLQLTRAGADCDYARCCRAAQALERLPLHVIDVKTPDAPDTVAGIEAAILGMPRRPSLVVIDTLARLVGVSASRRAGERREAVGEIIKALDALAKRLGIAFLVLAHLNRSMAASALYRAPRLEDLAESSAVEGAADAVVILHREDLYPTKKYDDGDPPPKGEVSALGVKSRESESGGLCKLKLRGEFQRFESIYLDPFDAPEVPPAYTVERDEDGCAYPEAAE